jgi:hypothetical protein
VRNGRYVRGEVINASFACADTVSGLSASQACVGTVTNGAAIDTATTGTQTFVVTAKNGAGMTETASVKYTVR